jgi:hypothetical protein
MPRRRPPDAGWVASPAAASAADCGASRPSERASASSDPRRGRLLRPCSRSRTAPTLSPDRCASCCCVSPAARRCSCTEAPSKAPAASRTPPTATILPGSRQPAGPQSPGERADLRPPAPSIAPTAIKQYYVFCAQLASVSGPHGGQALCARDQPQGTGIPGSRPPARRPPPGSPWNQPPEEVRVTGPRHADPAERNAVHEITRPTSRRRLSQRPARGPVRRLRD